jgi:hypothetical protein
MRRARAAVLVLFVGTPALAAHCGHGEPIAPQFPIVTIADTRRLAFHASGPVGTGSLDAQTAKALDDLLGRDPGARLVRLRVFAVGSERLVKIQRILEHLLATRQIPLPALSLLGVASLPDSGQLLQMESIVETPRVADPYGVVFLAGLASASGDHTMGGLARIARHAGVAPGNVLRVSCFCESLGQLGGARQAAADTFPRAELSLVHSYRQAVRPAVECEAVARVTDSAASGTRYLNFPGERASPYFSRAALVTTPRVLFSSTVAASYDAAAHPAAMLDSVRAAAERLGGSLHNVAMTGNYWMDTAARERARLVRDPYYGSTVPAATGVFMTSFASDESTLAFEFAIAAP